MQYKVEKTSPLWRARSGTSSTGPTACCLPEMKSRPLKLALVTRRYPPLIGGAEKVLSYLAGALAAEGADVTVVTSRMPGLGLAAQEEEPITSSNNAEIRRVTLSPGRLSIVRLETSRLRFWGTWRYMRNLGGGFRRTRLTWRMSRCSSTMLIACSVPASDLGFPVVLRPEGAGATGDIAWQSWGNFGRIIGRRCRQAAAFVAISKSIEHELREAWHSGTMRPSRLAEVSSPNAEGTADRGDSQRRSGSRVGLATPA